ncbi:MAG: dihydrolipoyl dehydrogenase [Deltaproteobacteria bacterium]|nr:dihydrolipoyl dehydrogenase [Deltaproteobacteria bacterium]
MTKEYDVAIIGAGTAGLTARSQVAKQTDNYVIIDDGILGTTCARVGCMPSKVLIEVANTYHRRSQFEQFGIKGADKLEVDRKDVMSHVRELRDQFTGGVKKGMQAWESHLIRKRARFMDANTLDLGDETIQAKKIIIATGSKPIVPNSWKSYSDYLIDTDEFFELTDLPSRMAVIGLGMVGIELGQALNRLGVEVIGITLDKAVGGLTDPEIQEYAFNSFAQEMTIRLGSAEILGEEKGGLKVGCNNETWIVDKVLLTMGRRPVINDLGLENLGIEFDQRGLPSFDPTTFQIEDLPVFIVGDVNAVRPILHEASDEGWIAGYNAMAEEPACFQRRTFLSIAFTEPNICMVGQSHRELAQKGEEFIIGKVSYDKQGRARIMAQNKGLVHIYGDKKDGTLLGMEMIAPHGEHLAHLMAWTMSFKKRAADILPLPFYHPVLEEALTPAFRDIARQSASPAPEQKLLRCQEKPV